MDVSVVARFKFVWCTFLASIFLEFAWRNIFIWLFLIIANLILGSIFQSSLWCASVVHRSSALGIVILGVIKAIWTGLWIVVVIDALFNSGVLLLSYWLLLSSSTRSLWAWPRWWLSSLFLFHGSNRRLVIALIAQVFVQDHVLRIVLKLWLILAHRPIIWVAAFDISYIYSTFILLPLHRTWWGSYCAVWEILFFELLVGHSFASELLVVQVRLLQRIIAFSTFVYWCSELIGTLVCESIRANVDLWFSFWHIVPIDSVIDAICSWYQGSIDILRSRYRNIILISDEFLLSSHWIWRNLTLLVLAGTFTAAWILGPTLNLLLSCLIQMSDVATIVHEGLTYLWKPFVISRWQNLWVSQLILVCIWLWIISVWICWHASSSSFLIMPVVHHYLSCLTISSFLDMTLHRFQRVLSMLAESDGVFTYASISHQASIFACSQVSKCICILSLAHTCNPLLVMRSKGMIHHLFSIWIVLLWISWNHLIGILSGIDPKSCVFIYILIEGRSQHLLMTCWVWYKLSLHVDTLFSGFAPHFIIPSFLGMHNWWIINPLPSCF